MEFCIKGDASNIFLPGVKLALAFLDSECGDSGGAQSERAMKDLKSILDFEPDLKKLRDWAESHFG